MHKSIMNNLADLIISKLSSKKFSVTIRVVQNANGEDVGIHTPENDVPFAREAEKVLSNHPEMIPLFQAGAILEVGVRKPHETHEYCTHYIGMQIAGVVNKDKKDKRRDYGMMGLSKFRTKDIPHIHFDVRLRYTGVPG